MLNLENKVSIQVPAGVKVDTWTYDGQTYANWWQEVELKDGKQIQIHLVRRWSYAKRDWYLKSLVNGFLQPVWLYLQKTWKQLSLTYHRKLSEIALDYQRGSIDRCLLSKDDKGDRHSLYDPIEGNMDLTNALVDVVKAAVSSNMKDYRRVLKRMNLGMQRECESPVRWYKQLQDLGPRLQASLQAIKNTNKDLTQNINDQWSSMQEPSKAPWKV